MRRYPVGAEVQEKGGVHFRVWAPASAGVSILLAENANMDGAEVYPLEAEGDGYYSEFLPEARTGQCYQFKLSTGAFPDPASRFQPIGPHGPSQIVDPSSFDWTDADWSGVSRERNVIYELHIGTFTPEGNWAAAIERLPYLAELGVTLLEIMPVADFPGEFGWGYDGVNLFAPTRLYGSPDDFRRFVDRAHRLGMGVILDVVYNHFGPDGCYLRDFSPNYFSTRYKNEWGEPINFDGEESGPVREYFIANAAYWIREFHLDGLRFDATQQIFDASSEPIIGVISRAARKAAGNRQIFLVGENEPQDARLVCDERSGGLDALWNDDFHHSAIVSLTGRSEAYYTDYHGRPQEFIAAAKWGFLFQGQRYRWQKQPRGRPALMCKPWQFVHFIENHDQVANSLGSKRPSAHASPAHLRAMTGLVLLMPGTPMLFQGQEFGATTPFHYFAHHGGELARMVSKGRQEFVCQFPSMAAALKVERLPAADARETFDASKLDWTCMERGAHRQALAMHRELIRIRNEDPVLAEIEHGTYDGAVLSADAFLLRYFSEEHGDRLLLVNFGGMLRLDPAPEPLLAPPCAGDWKLVWSSEDPAYGGGGTPALNWREDNWILPPRAALFLTEEPYDGNASRSKD